MGNLDSNYIEPEEKGEMELEMEIDDLMEHDTEPDDVEPPPKEDD